MPRAPWRIDFLGSIFFKSIHSTPPRNDPLLFHSQGGDACDLQMPKKYPTLSQVPLCNLGVNTLWCNQWILPPDNHHPHKSLVHTCLSPLSEYSPPFPGKGQIGGPDNLMAKNDLVTLGDVIWSQTSDHFPLHILFPSEKRPVEILSHQVFTGRQVCVSSPHAGGKVHGFFLVISERANCTSARMSIYHE